MKGRREKADHLQRTELASISAPALSAENEALLQAGGKQLASDVIHAPLASQNHMTGPHDGRLKRLAIGC